MLYLGVEIGYKLFKLDRAGGIIMKTGNNKYIVLFKLLQTTISANNGYTITEKNVVDLGNTDGNYQFDYCPSGTSSAVLQYSHGDKGFNIINPTSNVINVPTNNVFVALVG